MYSVVRALLLALPPVLLLRLLLGIVVAKGEEGDEKKNKVYRYHDDGKLGWEVRMCGIGQAEIGGDGRYLSDAQVRTNAAVPFFVCFSFIGRVQKGHTNHGTR
jgi:hypothetical protein